MNINENRLPVLLLAGLGLVSGILSAYVPDFAESFAVMNVPLYPGLLFGLVIGFGVYRWGNAGWTGVLLAFIATNIAWVAAVRGFYWITDDAKASLYLGGLLAGAVGAAGTLLGSALIIRKLRKPRAWILTVMAGAIAGLLVVPVAQSSGEEYLLLLFSVWQCVVAGSFGEALMRRAPGD